MAHVFRTSIICIVCVACAGVMGCASAARDEAPSRDDSRSIGAQWTLIETPLPVIPGRDLVIALRPLDDARALGDAPGITLGDGRVVESTLVFFTGEPGERTPGAWTAPAARVQAVRIASGGTVPDAEAGFLAAIAPIPADVPRTPLRIDGRLQRTAWIDPPDISAIAREVATPSLDANDVTALRALLEPIADDPLTSWRIDLLLDRPSLTQRLGDVRATFDDPALRAFAEQSADRWRVAIDALGDPVVARDLLARLTEIRRFADGVVRPAWSPVETGEAGLLSSLLNPRLDRATRARLARDFLSRWRPRGDSLESVEPPAAPLTPPGLELGPSMLEWSQASWSIARPFLPAADWRTSLVLERLPASNAERAVLRVRLECGAPSRAGDAVTIRLGPSDNPRAAWTITSDGDVRVAERSAPAPPTTVERTDSGWRAFIEFDDAMLESDGVLLLAYERVDARGVRTSWPLPAYPGSALGARSPIDITTWFGFDAP